MAKVTSKRQVTIPKRIADRFRIAPGDEIDWIEAGDAIRVVPGGEPPESIDRGRRLELFDAATARQRAREAGRAGASTPADRRSTRDELYARGRAG